jgi:flagellar hook-length control protein FliK
MERVHRTTARSADVEGMPEGDARRESFDSAISILGSWSPAARPMTDSTAAAGSEPARPFAEQIERALSRAVEQPGQSLRLLLEPEGLGMMQLRVELSDAGVRVSFAVEHADTAELVEATWPQLSAAFEQQGLTVDRVLVDLLGDPRGSDGAAFGQSTADHGRRPAMPQRPTDRAEARGELAPAALQEVTTRIDYRV